MDKKKSKFIKYLLFIVILLIIIFLLLKYCTVNKYSLTIDYGYDTEVVELKQGEEYLLDIPDKDGYNLIGWDIEGKKSKVKDNVFKMGIEDTKIKPLWELKKYTISFNLNGGSSEFREIIEYTEDTDTFKLLAPVKNGYKFDGWFTNSDFTGEMIEEIIKGSSGNKEIFAKWELEEYKIKYNLNGGIINNLVNNYTIESEDFIISKPIKNNYTFVGWRENDSKELNSIIKINKGTYGDKIFTAVFAPINYKIDYELNGGYLNKTVNKYNVESNVTLPIPNKNGYKFIGWFTNSDFSGDVVTNIYKGTVGDKKYYAKWEIENYTVSYELNNGVQGDNVTDNYNIESDTIILPFPSKEGYTFEGWYLNNEFSGSAYTNLEKGNFGNKTYYAKWKKFKEYKNEEIINIVTDNSMYDDKKSLFVHGDGIDFSKPSSITNGYGVYIMSSTKNDKYPIYYYRGAVENNNIIVGNYCWKIVRTTEQGGVKLIFNGLKSSDNKCNNEGLDTELVNKKAYSSTGIGISGAGYAYTEKTALKLSVKNDSTVSVGTIFSYDISYDKENDKYTLIGDKYLSTSSFTAEKFTKLKNHHYTCFKTTDDGCSEAYYVYMGRDAQIFYIKLNNVSSIDDLLNLEMDGNSTNTINSSIKTVVDDWYKNNFTAYTSYLEDTVFCNDRSIYNKWNLNSPIDNDNDIKMHFDTKYRTAFSGKPTIKCKYKNDSFTVSNTIGNGKLAYPVGLITYDEANFAGMAWSGPSDSYIQNGLVWWTMSPGFVSAAGVYNGVVHSILDHVAVNYTSGSSGGVRPSIALKRDVVIKNGDGSSSNPFVILTN